MDRRKPKRQKWNAKPRCPLRINGTIIRVSRRVVLTIETAARIRRIKSADSSDSD